MFRRVVRWLVAAAMTVIGVLHFVRPLPFVHIVPAWLPAPLALVYISGVGEIAGGLGLLWARTRVLAAWGLVALYVAVFPANINMALHAAELAPTLPVWVPWARLPFQLLFIAIALWLARGEHPCVRR